MRGYQRQMWIALRTRRRRELEEVRECRLKYHPYCMGMYYTLHEAQRALFDFTLGLLSVFSTIVGDPQLKLTK